MLGKKISKKMLWKWVLSLPSNVRAELDFLTYAKNINIITKMQFGEFVHKILEKYPPKKR